MNSRYIFLKLSLGLVVLVSALNACKRETSDIEEVKITTIYADELCKDLIEAEKLIFEHNYPKSRLEVIYASGQQVVARINQDSVRLLAMARPLDTNEVNYIKSKKLFSKSVKIAEDAIACITRTSCNIETLYLDSLKKQLNKNTPTTKTVFVLIKSHTGILHILEEKLSIKQEQLRIYAVEDSVDFYTFLKKHDNAVGILPLSWIESDVENLISNNFKILPITMNESLRAYPDQYHLSRNLYPLSKGIYLNLIGRFSDDAANFVNFCMKDIGQLIVLKKGLLPVNMPSREYYVKQ